MLSSSVELESAKQKYEQALQNFNYADADFVEKAVVELNIAMENYNDVLRSLKMKTVEI